MFRFSPLLPCIMRTLLVFGLLWPLCAASIQLLPPSNASFPNEQFLLWDLFERPSYSTIPPPPVDVQVRFIEILPDCVLPNTTLARPTLFLMKQSTLRPAHCTSFVQARHPPL
jgi:hypothetical protein